MNPECPVCAVKWGKSLHIGNCCCDGSVQIYFKGPDPLVPRQTKLEPSKQEEIKDRPLKLSKKERTRLQRHGFNLT